MTTQEIIAELTKNDRRAIRGLLRERYRYSDSYITRMFGETRKRTDAFRVTVEKYWEKKREIFAEIDEMAIN